MSKVQLILGGARSGKSSLAEQYAKAMNLPVTYLATAQSLDEEMQQRIVQHKAQRPAHWSLIESPTQLASAIESLIAKNVSGDGMCILVDCLTLWLSNCLCQPMSLMSENSSKSHRQTNSDDNLNSDETRLDFWLHEKRQLLTVIADILQRDNVHIIFVSNEVGHGIVPMGELSRQFVDQAGWLHQSIAKLAERVEFIMAGLPIVLKPAPVQELVNCVNDVQEGEF